MKTSKIGLTLFALMLMQSALHAQWSTNGSSIYYNSGNVGIGTSTPSQLLQVYNPSSDAKASILTGDGVGSAVMFFTSGSQSWLCGLNAGLGTDDYVIANQSGNGGYLVMTPTGQVGLGTNNPGVYKLDVTGGIRADSVIVNTSGADFVFDKHYRKISLDSLGKYIAMHKHLPGIPTAKDMEHDGVSIGALQTKMLQNLEELALDVVQEHKQIEALKKENAELGAAQKASHSAH